MNISSIVTNNAFFNPNYKAIISGDDGRELTWSEFDKTINKVGNALVNMGVKKGDVVAIYLPNSPEFLFTFFAVTRIGAIALPFNILYRTGEISYILDNSKARFLVGASAETEQNIIREKVKFPHLEKIVTVGDPVKEAAEFYSLISEHSSDLETVDCSADDLALLIYTSGTTGRPKGAMISHSNLIEGAELSIRITQPNDQDLFMTVVPFCHIFFVISILGPFTAGAGFAILQRFNAEKVLELISRYKVTHFLGVPTMFIFMLEQYGKNDSKKYDLSSWRFAMTAGASMPVEHINEIGEKFGIDVVEAFGITEATGPIAHNRLCHGKNGSVGPVGRGTQVIVVDESFNELPAGEVGEILIKGPGIFKGYWGNPEGTKEVFHEGWYCSGDLGKYDEDGYIYIVDRKKDMIVCGGYNVYPREVEEFIYLNPKVLEAAVTGVSDPARGEVPKAYIVLREGQEMTEQEMIDYCKQSLASYKVPRLIEFLPELPKNATGKILKRLLKQTITN